MRRVFVASCLLLWAQGAQAQVYRFRTYDSNGGLPTNSVYSIFQDSSGYLWFATDGGAARYDGRGYTTFSVPQGLADASVRGFVEDRDGRLWILTKGGLSRWDGTRFETLAHAQGLVNDEVRCGVRTRDGALWFGTSGGVSRWDGTRFTSFGPADGVPPGPVWALHEDRAGTLWLGSRGGGFARFDGARFVAFGARAGLPNDRVFGIADDPGGGLWLATDAGLVHFDGARFRALTTADGLPSDHVSSVVVDRHGRVWCGTFGGGLARYEDGRFTVFGRHNGLPDDYLTALLRDREDEIWIGSNWAGAFRFVSERFANYTASTGLGEGLVTGVAEAPDGSLWFSSLAAGLTQLGKDGSVRRFGAAQGLEDERVWALAIDSRGRVWTGGLSGASWFDGSRFRHFSLAELGLRDRVNAIIEDRKGRIWFGSGAAVSSGIVAWDGRTFTRYGAAQGLAHNQVNTFTVDRSGNLWICTEDGLSRFDGTVFRNYGLSAGLPSRRVLVAYEDERGALWLGTPAGVARFDGLSFTTYSTRDGLVNNYVHAVTSRDGVLWIGTSRGISAFDGARFTSYTVKDGLISHEIATGAALSRPDGSVWFGTAGGVVRHRVVKETGTAVAPRVVVTGVRLRDAALAPGAGLTLAHDQGTLSFDFLGLSFADEQAVRYSYRLAGLDAEWSPPEDERSVRFTNLAPGAYRFEVKARSAAGLWSEPVGMALTIRPAFWQTWWFRLAGLLAVAALATGAYGWRIRALTRAHAERLTALRQLLESIRVINSGLDLPTVLQNITDEAARLVDGEAGGIGLVREQRLLFERVWIEDHWEAVDESMALGEGVAGRVAATGRPLIVDDVGSDPSLVDREVFARSGAVGLIDVPIIDRAGRVVGVLEVRRPPGRAPFADADRQMLESLAHQAAVAIENAALYGALAEKKVMVTESLWAAQELFRHEQEMTRMLEELNRMKTNFMIVTSHEMRTPLTLLKGYHEALLEGYLGPLAPAQEQCLTQGHRTVDRMIASFNDILEMLAIDERRAVPDRQPIDVVAVAREALAELAPFVERRRQRTSLTLARDLPDVRADADKIRLVLLNLIENAIKFTPDGGEIRVRVEAAPGAIHVCVEDSGIGIESWELERVFDRFYAGPDALHHSSGTYQFKARGAGLGLAIAKGHVEAHGGRIWAESAGAGRGSVFHVTLPAEPVEQAMIPAREVS